MHVAVALSSRLFSPSFKGLDASLQLFGHARDIAWIFDYRDELRTLPGISLSLKTYSHAEKLLSTLEGSNNIHSVQLQKTQITDEMVRSLATQKNLNLLILTDCEQFEGNLRLLEPLKQLNRLVLHRTPINQGDLAALQNFPALTELGIESKVITPQNVEALSACARLQKLYILDSNDQTVATMALKSWPGMALHLSCQHVTPQCIPDLARMSLAKEIRLDYSPIFPADLERAEIPLENVVLRNSFKLPN
ncbi:leucine-rich repeat domain-containing protein [Planctomicrobium piriforme]|uniref:Leucine Rich repeats (2 copies) n=1 Tax=Planctomicrobium piriforme TaxID=1576369 RepID=A0A1I3SAG5_9PLAN|nr:hypothetical protein [Planctomicrobium piriforme]SFJ54537.1 hypothetical protein SAMN05421753_12343 [Planctomicrobium piriforme]